MEADEQYPITLVTAYFDLGDKQIRYAGDSYPGWIRNLLSFVRWPLVIFCDEQSVDMIREARGDKPAVYHVTRLEDFYVYKYRSVFRDQCQRDYMAYGIALSTDVSIVWNEKTRFLQRASEMNPFRSERIFWCDIAAFRATRSDSQMFRLSERIEWPNLRVCRALPRDKIAVSLTNYLPPSSLPPLSKDGLAHNDVCRDVHVNGAFFGGSPEVVAQWCDAYYECLERRVCAGYGVTLDEHIMSAAFVSRPELVHGIPGNAVSWGRNTADRCWTHYRWYYLNGGQFPFGYLCREILLRMGNVRFMKWMILTLLQGSFKLNWKALRLFGGQGKNDKSLG